MRQNYPLTKGLIDKDTDPRLIEKGNVYDVENAIIYNGKAFKPKGMAELINSQLPAGHSFIGGKFYKDYIYFFSENSPFGAIGRYNVKTNVNQNLLQADWLNFSPDYRINNINIIEDESNGRLLIYWTDGLNEPRYVDVNQLLSGNKAYFTTAESVSVIKAPPQKEPEIRMIFSDEVGYNDIIDKSFSFAYRYTYKTGEKTTLSFYSRPAFIGESYFADNTGFTQKNKFNGVEITVNIDAIHTDTGEDIEKIEIFSKATGSNLVSKIETIDHDGTSASYTFDFFANGSYSVLSDAESQQLYNNVPHVAESQEVIDNALMYGKYKDGLSNNITPNWSVDMRLIQRNQTVVSSNAGTSNASSQYVDLSASGQIYKGDIIAYVINGNEISTGDDYDISITMVAEKDYSDLVDFFEDPDARVREILNAKGIDYTIEVDLVTYTFSFIGSTYQFNGTQPASSFVVDSAYSSYVMREGKVYDFGLIYFDKFNRSGEIIEYKGVKSPVRGATLLSKPRVTITHEPPTWATKFKILRKEYSFDYQKIEFSSQQDYDGYKYIQIDDQYTSLVSDEVKYLEDPSTLITYPVLKVEVTDASHPLGAGRWIVIDYISGVYFTSRPYFAYFGNEITGSVFKEIPGTYDIIDGYHTSEFLYDTDYNQSISQPSFRKTLIYDGDVLYDETYKVGATLWYSPVNRSWIESENFKQQTRGSSVTYSDIYVEDSGYNGLSTFNLSLVNYKDYDRSYGDIKKIYSRDTDLVIFMEDKIIAQPFRKDILQTVSGVASVTATDAVLGTHTSYQGEYGMSHSESFAFRDRTLYWVDAKRGEIMRLDVNGLYPVSENGMNDFWNEYLKANADQNMYGAYDPLYNEYLLFNGTDTWAYSRARNGWTRKMTYSPDGFIFNGIDVYSAKGESLYQHYTHANPNDYYGVVVDSKITFYANEAFSDLKVAHALYLEGDEWPCIITDTNGQYTSILSYEDKENFKYAGIPMIESKSESQGIGGIGNISFVTTFTVNVPIIPDGLSVGDELWTESGLVGTLISITDLTLRFMGGAITPSNGNFIFYKKNAKLESAPVRDYIFKLELTSAGIADDELFAVNIEVQKSNV